MLTTSKICVDVAKCEQTLNTIENRERRRCAWMDLKPLWLCISDVYLYLTLTIADFVQMR